jgi:hypothetical protein
MDAVISLTWASAYQSVRGLVQHFAASWRAAGLEMIEISLSDADWQQRLQTTLNTRRVRFVFCTSGIGVAIDINGENLWTKLKLPVFSLLLDHPAYFAKQHVTQPENVVLGYMFADHALFQAQAVRADNIVTTLHYGIPELPVAPLLSGPPRVILAKTGNAPAALAADWRAAPKLERILHDALDEIDLFGKGNAHAAAFPGVLAKAAAARNIYLQPYGRLTRFLIAQLDDYIRRLKSTAMAQALRGFEVDVFGRAWEHIDISGARAKFHGPLDYAALEAQLAGATASLTMNPNIDFSAHDRFFTALGAGIMPISDGNAYTAQNFPELAPYLFDFRPGRLEAVLERVFAAPEAARALARDVRRRARPAHGVEVAARDILETMSAAAMAATARPGQAFFVP